MQVLMAFAIAISYISATASTHRKGTLTLTHGPTNRSKLGHGDWLERRSVKWSCRNAGFSSAWQAGGGRFRGRCISLASLASLAEFDPDDKLPKPARPRVRGIIATRAEDGSGNFQGLMVFDWCSSTW